MTTIAQGDIIIMSDFSTLEHKTANAVHIEQFILDDYRSAWGGAIGPGGKVYVCMDGIALSIYPGDTEPRDDPGILTFASDLAGMLTDAEQTGVIGSGGGTLFGPPIWSWGRSDGTEDVPMDICFTNGKAYVIGYARRPSFPTSPVYQRDNLAITELSLSGDLLNRWIVDVDYDAWNGVFYGRITAGCDGTIYYSQMGQSIFHFNPVTGVNLPKVATMDKRLPFHFGDLAVMKNPDGSNDLVVALSSMNRGSSFGHLFATSSVELGGPVFAIALSADKASFFTDDGFRKRPPFTAYPADRYNIFRFTLAAGADVANYLAGDGSRNFDIEVTGMDTRFNPCGGAGAGTTLAMYVD